MTESFEPDPTTIRDHPAPMTAKPTLAKVSRLVLPRAAQLLAECHKLAKERMPALLKLLLDKADDAFFELANKADSSQRQQMYFDAMRELRLKRKQMEADFFGCLETRYDECFSPPVTAALRNSLDDLFNPELSLVDENEVEESLAVTNFAEGLNARCKHELFALDQRIGQLLNDPELKSHTNPFGPLTLGHALRAVTRHIDTNIEARLTLLKMADRQTGPGLSEVYRSLNEFLIRENILPRLSPTVGRRDGPSRTRVIIETEHGTEEAAGPDVFSTLQSLMHPGATGSLAALTGGGAPGGGGARSGGGGGVSGHTSPGGVASGATGFGGNATYYHGGNGQGAGGMGQAPGGAGIPGLPLVGAPQATATVVSALTGIQQGDVSIIPNFDPALLTLGSVNVLRTLRDSGAVGELNQTDTLTLDIVTLLFDYILDDPTIPDSMKALIGRLQIPLLKVALLDKDLFSKKTHPARQLLDALAHAAMGWSEGTRDGDALYEKCQYIVYRIVEEFDRDLSLFTQLLSEFNSFLTEDARNSQRQAELAAKSLHAKERIVLAKMAVDDAVKVRFEGAEVREFVRQFVRDYWRQQLIVTYVEAGPESEAWHAQLGVIDELIWSVQPKNTPEERRELTNRLSPLLKALKVGMKELAIEPAICSKFLTMLASVHVVSVKNCEEASLAEKRLVQREPAPVEAVTETQSEQEFVKKALDRIFTKKVVDAETLEIDIAALESEVGQEPEVEEPVAVDEALMARVMELDLGDWLEFSLPGESPVRARFTWISGATGRYLFTDRKGRKAFDLTLPALLQRFEAESVTRITSPPDPLFERAIGELLEKLEQRQVA
jgi:Protein of unknown function (DUF1631)